MSEIDCTVKRECCYWQTVGAYKRSNSCYNCERNRKAEEKKKDNFIDILGKVNELYEYLTDQGLPEGVTCEMPKLSGTAAFSVLWFLQEITCCLPDHIEQCQECEQLYDSDCEGYYLDDQYCHRVNGRTIAKKYWGHYCDYCVPNIDFEVK